MMIRDFHFYRDVFLLEFGDYRKTMFEIIYPNLRIPAKTMPE